MSEQGPKLTGEPTAWDFTGDNFDRKFHRGLEPYFLLILTVGFNKIHKIKGLQHIKGGLLHYMRL